MPFNIEYDADEDVIVSTFLGPLTMSLTKEYIAALLPILEETKCKKLLSDSRNCEMELSSMDILKFPKMAETSPLTVNLKRAVLLKPDTSGYELYESLSTAHGQQVKLFEKRAEALAWLQAEN